LGNGQRENRGDSHVSFVDDSDEVGEERTNENRSINLISETLNTNLIHDQKSTRKQAEIMTQEGFMSDECDEKRSYTP
jgi:hypothetical protein